LTDPPYGMKYRSNMRKERHAPIVGDSEEPYDLAFDMAALLMPKLEYGAHVLVFAASDVDKVQATMNGLADAGLTVSRTPLIWDKGSGGMGDLGKSFAPRYEAIVHATKGEGRELYPRPDNVLAIPRISADRHPTEKPEDLLTVLIDSTTAPGALVADPFGGVGSTAAAAKASERRWWSCELDEGYWKIGEERLS
jgi:hypothetical protein